MVRAALVFLAACAATPASLPAQHPASPTAPSGRVAGAPPALRAGAIGYPDVPKTPPPAQHHHHHGH